MSIIPGIETGAPERTLTSSGSAGSPNRRPTAASTAGHPRAAARRRARPASRSARNVAARRGGDDEARRDRQAEVAGHDPEVGGLAADERLRLGQRRRVPGVEGVRVGHRTVGSAASGSGGIAASGCAACSRSARQTRSGRQRQVADDDAGRVADGGRHGGRDRQQRALAHPLRAVRARSVLVLDDVAVHLERQVHARRDAVVDRAEVPDPAARRRGCSAPSGCGRGP